MINPINFSRRQEVSSLYGPCSSSQKSIQLFYTTFFSPNDFLLNYNDDSSIRLSSVNTCISLSLADNLAYISKELRSQKNDWYTYLIEREHSEMTIPIVNKTQRTIKNLSFSHCELWSTKNISLHQMYFIDSNNSTFHTGLLESFNSKNVELQTLKQFPLHQKLKTKIREFKSKDLQSFEKMTVDLQNKAISQFQSLEESRKLVFGNSIREKKEGRGKPFYLLEAPNREEVQLSVLTWLDYFLEIYQENPEYSVKMLLDNRKILLSQICSHIEENRSEEYNDCKHIPSTLPSLELVFATLESLYVTNHITKKNVLEFLLPIEKNATHTCFLMEEYYNLPVGLSYIYLFREVLRERKLQPEIFLRMNKSISCKHSYNPATFLFRLQRAIKLAKLKWKFYNDTRGIYNLYPLMKDLDACRIHDNVSLNQRIRIAFSYHKVPFKKVLDTFYTLEGRMKRKDCFPLESKKEILSLSQIREKLQFQKQMYPKVLQECQDKNNEAKKRRIQQKKKEIADLEKFIKKLENWNPDDQFDPSALLTFGFCMLLGEGNIASMKRKAYSARQDALRELENWERNQKSRRPYKEKNTLGLFELVAPFVPPSICSTSSKQRARDVNSSTDENPTDLALQRRLENLRRGSEDPKDTEIRRRLENLRRDFEDPKDTEIRRRLENLRRDFEDPKDAEIRRRLENLRRDFEDPKDAEIRRRLENLRRDFEDPKDAEIRRRLENLRS